MKKFRAAIAAILAVCSLMGLAGCAENREQSPNESTVNSQGSSSNEIGDNSSSEENSSEGNESSEEVIKTQYAPIKLTDNNTLNSIRLFDAISEDKKTAMFSPVSLNMALGLIEAGAGGETKAELDSYLQTENFSEVAADYLKFVKENRNREKIEQEWANVPASVLEIANSFWADNALPVKDEYKQNIAGKFGAEITNLDFANKVGTINTINGWVNEKTHEMIPSILEDYNENTAAFLINTVYFASPWSNSWNIAEDNKESFTQLDGTVKELPLMYNEANAYFENDKATAFSSRYMNSLEFIGILPKDEGDFTLESLDIPALLESRTFEYDVEAAMPRFTFDTSYDLEDALKAAGLGSIFDSEKADFSGISDMELYVSQIIQKTRIELDENGTKAAAATMISMDNKAFMPNEPKSVRLDRPFAFMIYDSEKDQILFVGKVMTVES